MNNPEELVDTALRFVEHINRGEVIALSRLMTEDYEFVDLAGEIMTGRSKMTQGWADYFKLCPQYMIHISDLYLAEDRVIMIGRTTGSHLGQSRFKEFRDTLIWVARVIGGRIAAWHLYYDTERVRKELGANINSQITVQGSIME